MIALLLLCLSFVAAADYDSLVPYAEAGCFVTNFTQQIDHTNPKIGTFNQRYYVCPRYLSPNVQNGSVVVFLGNESPLNNIVQPIVFENIRRMNALLIEVEHRYYGKSFPFTNLTTSNYQYLTMEQVMADTKSIVEAVRANYSVPQGVPAVVLGGSYGGQLAIYHRITYSKTFQAAIASSAPVNYVLGTQMLNDTVQQFHTVLAKAYSKMGSETCRIDVEGGMDLIASAYNMTVQDRRIMAQRLQLCNTSSIDDAADIKPLLGFFYDGFVGPAQLNNQKPYMSYIQNMCNVVNATLTRYPLDLLRALSAAYQFQNGTEEGGCNDFVAKNVVLPPASADAIWPSYNYQSCTQGAVNSGELSSNGSSGMLPKYTETVQDIRLDCLRYFGPTVPNLQAPSFTNYQSQVESKGGIVWTNGDLDHWSGGSVMTAIANKTAVVIYPNGSHCTDTHAYNWNNTEEPSSYPLLRAQAMDYAMVWMDQYRKTSWSHKLVPSFLLALACML
jgi:lysosomal Pro-X carboxypeptidase